ncbi:cytochrome P450 [Myriangium duriaei CBS 260.36]|uniref:Cytochrome P450 n=1 Tax=Myriangium duriaei CBS 260.36 TaxID=1168546 RepID=A0A9P4J5J2_9PEZI|nr:cytochrome P450 [Myriangium duriaei CBS 260.36]
MALGLAQILFTLGQGDRKIKRLGGHAPQVRWAWTSFGMNMIWSSVQCAEQYQHLAWWSDKLDKCGKPGRPWTFEARLFGTRVVYTVDHDNIKAILSSQFDEFEKGEALNRESHDFFGNSFINTDGQQWWDYRKLLRPHLLKTCLSNLDILENKMQKLLPLLSASQIVNATDLFMRLSLDAFTASFLGHKGIESLDGQDQDFAMAFREVQRVQNLRGLAGPLKILIPRQNFYAGIEVLNRFVEPIVDQTIGLKEQSKGGKDKEFTFLHTLSGFTSDRKVIRDQIISLLLAGRDSTSNTLSWMFYNLGLRPDLVKRLRAEVLAKSGQQCPTFDDLQSMSLLQNTISETLRLYPPVVENYRQAVRDTSLPRGGGPDGMSPIGILKGTPVGFSTLYLHRKANKQPTWITNFPDCSEFAPDRWTVWTPEKGAYIPFSMGRRGCIGRDFALTFIAYVTARILQTYTSIDCAMEGELSLDTTTILRPSRDIKLSFN